jgi:hypothetical protein
MITLPKRGKTPSGSYGNYFKLSNTRGPLRYYMEASRLFKTHIIAKLSIWPKKKLPCLIWLGIAGSCRVVMAFALFDAGRAFAWAF